MGRGVILFLRPINHHAYVISARRISEIFALMDVPRQLTLMRLRGAVRIMTCLISLAPVRGMETVWEVHLGAA